MRQKSAVRESLGPWKEALISPKGVNVFRRPQEVRFGDVEFEEAPSKDSLKERASFLSLRTQAISGPSYNAPQVYSR